MSPNCKIIYFDARGRAECLRLLFVKAGRKFEDVRLTHETWAAEKPNTPFGQLPVIEIDGKRYGQSCAIGSYLAREFGLYGKSNLDALIIDQVVHLGLDLMNSLVKAHYEQDETKKAELMKTLTEVAAPKYLNDLDKLLTKTGFFVGNSITYGDIFTFDFLDNLCRRKVLTTANHPKVQALVEAVANDEKIKPYLSTRKETEN